MTTYGFYGLTEDVSPPRPTHPEAQAFGPASTPLSQHGNVFLPWPGTCRDGFAPISHEQYVLHLTTDDNRIKKDIEWAELLRLPATTEVQKLHSKAGWMTQGFWSTLTFQRLLTKIPGTEPYHWVELISLTGQRVVMPKSRLNAYRLIYKCDDKFLPPTHGGPLWVHCFDHYVEYGIPQVSEIRFLSQDAPAYHPSQDYGFPQTAMRVQTGNYYMIHKDTIKHLRY
jgi:DMSO/TMAO reductase YedYZ molybdopterin-dependent catalytic subunit